MKTLNRISRLGFFAILLGLLLYSCSTDDQSLTSTEDDSNKVENILGVDVPEPLISFAELQHLRKEVNNGKSISKDLAKYKKAISQRFEAYPDFYPEDYVHNMNMVLSAIDADAYECNNADNALLPFLREADSKLQGLDFLLFLFYGDFPFYDAIFFQTPSDPQTYGVNGEYTDALEKTLVSLKRFWDIDNSNINMYGMHASTMQDEKRVFEIFDLLYIGTEEGLRAEAKFVANHFQNTSPEVQNNPLFSFNAVAIRAPFIDDYRIVMGDGIMAGYESIGLGDIAPQAILAHEYAHHIQFENGYFEAEDSPAATRRTELMADAYSAYFLKHQWGGGFRTFKISDFLDVFFTIGDCGFDNPGHHGTYRQRLAAAQWGIELAYKTGRWNGRILPAQVFFERFEDSLDDIINCDACLSD